MMNKPIKCLMFSFIASALLMAAPQQEQWRRRQPQPPPTQPSPPTTPPATLSTVEQIANDMQGSNEGTPQGVPSSYDFYYGPVIEQGNNPGSQQAMVLWGTVYVPVGGNPATNTRVNISGCHAYWLRKSTGVWTSFGPDNAPDVEDYPEDFQGPSAPTNVRTESDGSISVIPARGMTSHFYAPYPRIPIANTDFGGVVNYCEMRLILDNPNGTDDRGIAQFLGNVGGDYYPSTTGPGIENNPGIGGGKFKYVREDWRSFAMTTLTQAQLTANPPPVDLTGINP